MEDGGRPPSESSFEVFSQKNRDWARHVLYPPKSASFGGFIGFLEKNKKKLFFNKIK
uniref:Uncharacterized protein n=1 Tax=uncultured prokaryote TaxID=198431 RepID=A0A0H5QLT0_9ZZZZ|nr:hypothetical protein [uncultured prokaryote]